MLSRQARYSFIAFLLIAAVLATLWILRPEQQQRVQEKRITRVSTVALKRMDLQPRSYISGTLQPLRRASLHFQVIGQVTERLVEPGQRVDTDQVLIRLDAADYADAVVRAAADFAQELATLKRDKAILALADENSELASREFKRLHQLGKSSLASQSLLEKAQQEMLRLELEEAKLRYSLDTADSRIKVTKSALNRAEREVQRTSLKSPFNGIVNRVNLEQGDQATLRQLAVEVVDVDSLLMYAEVASDAAAVLQLGQSIRLNVAGKTIEGKLTALQIDPEAVTFTHPIEIRVKEEGLLPGMLARADIQLGSVQQALVAPFSAVLRDEGRAYVFVVEQDQLRKVPVEIGVRSGEWLQISGDIEAGEIIVARNVAALSDAQSILIRNL